MLGVIKRFKSARGIGIGHLYFQIQHFLQLNRVSKLVGIMVKDNETVIE